MARRLPSSSVPGLPSKRPRALNTSMPKTSSATALAFWPGVFITATPRSFAASVSMLS